MYDKGDILYLISNSFSGFAIPEMSPERVHDALQSTIRPAVDRSPTDRWSRPSQALVYQMLITHAYTPHTMSVVCRVQIVAVFNTIAAVARHISLPNETVNAEPGVNAREYSRAAAVDHRQKGSPEYILKLYDHRLLVNIRERCDKGRPYSETKARAYHKYQEGPPVPYFADTFLEQPGKSGEDWTEGDQGLFEAWMQVDANRTYERELSVYNLLSDLQGTFIPRLYDTVACSTRFPFPPVPSVAEPIEEARTEDAAGRSTFVDWRRINGILLEYVPGITLRSFVHACLPHDENLLRRGFASIADEAVALVRRIDLYPMINRDVRLDNILVRQSYLATLGITSPEPKTAPCSPALNQPRTPVGPAQLSPCVAIDFGQVRLRYPDETDEQWRRAKEYENEEGAIVLALESEIMQVLKENFFCSNLPDSRETSLALRAACKDEQTSIWTGDVLQRWHRELSSEEYDELMSDPTCGQHPGNWSAKGFYPIVAKEST